MLPADRSETSSPFWQSRQSGRTDAAESPKVIGASYSHTDILKFESLSLSGSRPRTPPGSSTSRLAASKNFISNTRSRPSIPTPRSYHSFISDTSRSWDLENDGYGESSGRHFDDEDEDEFGLPSLTATRKRSAKENGSLKAPQISPHAATEFKQPPSPSWKHGSGDISEERGIASYPTAKSNEGKILRPQYKDILQDPANALHLITHPTISPDASTKDSQAHDARLTRINKFKRMLQSSSISLSELRDSCWSGIPEEVRAMSWQLLLGYLPTSSERRVSTLERKRREYLDGVRQAFDRGNVTGDKPILAGASATSGQKGRGRGLDEAVWHQISIDVPRTNPHIELYAYEATQRSLERILYVWAIRHPASGYVQGINDLVTPFWQVFLASYISDSDIESGMDPGQLPKAVLDAVEADSFWCLTKLLDGIQDNYVHAQPGIQRQVSGLRDLTKRIDANLVKHLDEEGVEFIQFSFRWMNCLLMREISVKNTVRMWDTYMAEEQGFSDFHLYVCAAFLVKWSEQLMKMDFQEVMMFLQALPTRDWSVKDIELLLSEAFIWQSLFRGSSAHLKDSTSS